MKIGNFNFFFDGEVLAWAGEMKLIQLNEIIDMLEWGVVACGISTQGIQDIDAIATDVMSAAFPNDSIGLLRIY